MSEVKTDKVSSITTNGDLTLDPNGTGKVVAASEIDLNGNELILDADGDTSITADTDDQIDFKAGGSDRMTIQSNGDIGIGTATGDITSDGNSNRTYVTIQGSANRGRLNLGSTASNGADVGTLGFTNGANTVGEISVDSDSGSQTAGKMNFATSGSVRLEINSSGNSLFTGGQYVLGINSGTYNWYMGTTNNRLEAYDGSGTLRGYLTLAGAWTDTSDTAFKRDISDLTYGITTVKVLQPRVYHVAGTTGTDDPQIGFVAQEIETHVPEVVTGEDGSKGVAYGRLTAVLTKALQEAITKIETLETQRADLETRVAALEAN